MSINNQHLQELVDQAVPPGEAVNSANLHELLHVIVVNLADLNNINMDYKCSARTTAAQAKTAERNQQNVNAIKEQVKDLTTMSAKQKKLLAELELKVKSLEEELNKVSKSGQPAPGARTRSRSRSLSRAAGAVRSNNSKKSLKTHSCVDAKKNMEWTTWDHPGKSSKMNVVNTKQSDIQIPELKRWIETKLRSHPAGDDLPQRIDQLVKEKMHSTVVPDLKKMIEHMMTQSYKEQRGKSGSVPLCISCQNAAGANNNQVSSKDCLCVIKRRLKNASASSKMNVPKR